MFIQNKQQKQTLSYINKKGDLLVRPMQKLKSLYMNSQICSALKISKQVSEIILGPSGAPATYNAWLRHCTFILK